MTPADQVKAFRARFNLTRAELARRLPVSLRAIEEWEGGRRNPPAYLGRLLASVERELVAERAAG